MRLLIIGKTGQVGSELCRQASGWADIHAPGRETLDIEKRDQAEREIAAFRPDVVVNTAAFHNLPRCETEPGRAFAVNCTAVRDLATACRKADARLVTFSTDYVFSGAKASPYAEVDCPAPLQTYGISRLAGEHAALATHPDGTFVIRTCGVYGLAGAASNGGNFIDNRVAEARAGKPLTIASEQIVSPTSAHDLAKAVLALLKVEAAEPGIYHLVNEGACSWYELTRKALEILGLPAEVTPIDRGGIDITGFRRPLFSALANTKAKALGIALPRWEEALRGYLARRV